jgi:CBS domain-containing protein
MIDWLLQPVSSLMTEEPVGLDPQDSFEHAEMLMATAGTRHWPVSREGRLVGFISLRALLAVGYRTGGPDAGVVGDAMSAPPAILDPDIDVGSAAHLMASYHFTCLPVVDGRTLVGVVTSTDFVRIAVDLMRDEAEECGASATVAHLMTARPITVLADRPIGDAERLMRHGDLCHLPVIEGDRLRGMLSERDLLHKSSASLPIHRTLTIDQVAQPAPIVTFEDTSAMTAGAMMIHRGIGALPVLRGGRLVGILTRGDFLGFVVARASGLGMPDGAGSPI